jgi:hypothetical protein
VSVEFAGIVRDLRTYTSFLTRRSTVTRIVEFIRWRVQLWLVAALDHADWSKWRASQRAHDAFVGKRRLMAFLDRVSPFTPETGYRRSRIRRIASRISVPWLSTKRTFWNVAYSLLKRVAPYTGPGRYRGNESADQLKAEWLDGHTEYAGEMTGESESFGVWAALFAEIDVPWSLKPESWLLTTDSQGFVGIGRDDLATLGARFEEIERDYTRWLINTESDSEHEQRMVDEGDAITARWYDENGG